MRQWLINVVIGIALAVGTIVTVASGLASIPHLIAVFVEGVALLHSTLSAKQTGIVGGVGLGIALAVFLVESRRGRGLIRRPIAAVALLWVAISAGIIVAPYHLSTHGGAHRPPKESRVGDSSEGDGSSSVATSPADRAQGGRKSVLTDGSQAESRRIPLRASKSSASPCGCSSWTAGSPPQREAGGWSEPEEEWSEGWEEEEWDEEEAWEGGEESWGEEEWEEEAWEEEPWGGEEGWGEEESWGEEEWAAWE